MRDMARGIDTKPYLEWLDGVESVAVSPNTPEERLIPAIPAEIVAEVRSPNDRLGFREEEIRRYLAWGVPLAFDIDPEQRLMIVHTAPLTVSDRFEDQLVPWLQFEVRHLFDRLDRLGP
jgi:Uma2 family endonuclease